MVDGLGLFNSGWVPQVVELNGTEESRASRLESWKGNTLDVKIRVRKDTISKKNRYPIGLEKVVHGSQEKCIAYNYNAGSDKKDI